MATCNHGNSIKEMPDALARALPDCQAGMGRHKCAICAYDYGLKVSRGEIQFDETLEVCPHEMEAPLDLLQSLPDNQGGLTRHKCAYTAYYLGINNIANDDAVVELDLPKNPTETESKATVLVRIGQSVFRKKQLNKWSGVCAVTQIDEPAMLRASHILPWSKCKNNFQRLDEYNGILLSADWDAAFDSGLCSFTDEGQLLLSEKLSPIVFKKLINEFKNPIEFSLEHIKYIKWHRENIFMK